MFYDSSNTCILYLPPGVVLSPQAGQHLNVALPIHQSVQGEAQYYSSLRKQYYELKNSPNPLIRQCYKDKADEQYKKIAFTRRSRLAEEILSVIDLPVHFSRDSIYITVANWQFRLSRQTISVEDGDTVRVQFYISHPMCEDRYTIMSLPIDPESRLKISIGDPSARGLIWLKTTGERAVFKMNTLVDMLEGLEIHEPSDRMRRWIPNSQRSHPPATYTKDVLDMLEIRKQAKSNETDEASDA